MATFTRWNRGSASARRGLPKALDRYCTALARVDGSTTLRELAAAVEKRVRWHGRPVRALHPFEPADLALLEAVNRGEFAINGLRNRDLQALLHLERPRALPKLVAVLPLSAANYQCCALTALFGSRRIPTATKSPHKAGSPSTPCCRLNVPPLSNLQLWRLDVFASGKKFEL